MSATLYLVELTVSDWPAALAWYAEVLGVQPALRVEGDRFALFQAGPSRLALKQGQARAGSVLLTLEVADLAAKLASLESRGIRPEGPVKTSPEGYRRAMLRDPDGHRLSLFEWCDPSGRTPAPGA